MKNQEFNTFGMYFKSKVILDDEDNEFIRVKYSLGDKKNFECGFEITPICFKDLSFSANKINVSESGTYFYRNGILLVKTKPILEFCVDYDYKYHTIMISRIKFKRH